MNPLSSLQTLFTMPEHRILFEATQYWVTVRSFRPASRMLVEVSCNKNLPKEQHLTPDQVDRLTALGLKGRRQGYSFGQLYTLSDPSELSVLSKTIEDVFSVFGVDVMSISTAIVPSPSIKIFNRILVGQMKQLARDKDHQLRLQMYTTLIDATLIALVNDDGSLKKCDTIVNLDCFGAFTDEKHALQYNPRGQHLQEMSMLQILKRSIEQNAGSLWLNPKGETRGELYKTELDSLWARVKRFV